MKQISHKPNLHDDIKLNYLFAENHLGRYYLPSHVNTIYDKDLIV